MGMADMFSDSANLSSLLDTNEQLQVSDVIHKAFIEVNEHGSEAGAVTGNNQVLHSIFDLYFNHHCF